MSGCYTKYLWLEKHADENLLKIKKGKYLVKGMHRTAGTHKSCGVNELKSSYNTKDFLGFIRKRFASRSREMILPSTQGCWVHTWSSGSCSGLSKTREMWSYWTESSAGPRKQLRNWSFPNRKGWDSEIIGVIEPWDKEAQGNLISVNK